MPFLTPSPSPHLCVAKIPNRNDASPPAKKQRFSSPSPPQARTKPIPKSLPSTAKIPQTVDYVKERHAAMVRLFDVWSSLAERYAKPIDEDDIVDIVTGEIVQDRGVVSGWDESTKGFFTSVGEKKKKGNASKAQEGAEEEGRERWEEDGDETDELAVSSWDESKKEFFTDVEEKKKKGNASKAGERTHEGAEEEGRERRETDGGETDELDPFATEDVRNDEEEFRLKPVAVAPHTEAEDNITPVTGRVLEVEKRRKEPRGKGKARDRMEGKGGKDAPIEIDLDEGDDVYSSDEDLEAYRIQLLQFRTPLSARPPPASSKCPSPDEDDAYQAQPSQFRTPLFARPPPLASSKCLSPDEDDTYQAQLSQFQTPLFGWPPPALYNFPSPDEDDGLEIYQAQLRQFRSTSKIPVSADDGYLPTGDRSDCRQVPSSSTPSTVGLDDSQTSLYQFRTPRPRYKQKWRIIVDSDDEFSLLGLKNRPSTLPSSPAASDLADYRSDSPATLPPPSSSPVREDGSDDELYGGWDLG